MEFSFLSFLDLVCVQRWLIFVQGFGYFHWFYKFTQFALVSVFLLVCLLSQSEFCLFDFFICFSLVWCFVLVRSIVLFWLGVLFWFG